MTGTATVEGQNPKVAPTLTAGKITPEVLYQWERACKEYFRVKEVTAEKQVVSVLSRLQDISIADWIETDEAVLVALDFPTFMTRLRKQVLEKEWDRNIKLSMLASKQGGRPFEEWARSLVARNALLRGRPYHLSDEALREMLENNMDRGLGLRVRRAGMGKDLPLRGLD
jgi:hypothetical protein